MKTLRKLIKNQKGATAIEYALIVALIAVLCLVAYKELGQKIKEQTDKITSEMTQSGSETGT